MDAVVIAQFALATLMPVAACALLWLLRERTAASRIPTMGWHVVVGVVFGIIAIIGTEAGIPLDGAMMNVRDAAPIVAGLFFSGPAGIIAGVIGGVERWFAVYWGVGEFTRAACSLGTIFAGVYAALLRKFMFERHIPNLSMSFATGVVVEVLHLMLVFFTNPDQPTRAFQVVQACAIPMTFCVGLSTMLSSLTLTLLNRKPLITPVAERNVARILHTRLLVAVAVAFFLTVGFTVILQTNISRNQTAELLKLNIEDVERDIVEASDANLIGIAKRAAAELPVAATATNGECGRLVNQLDVSEVNVVNEDGIIVASNVPSFIGFDMASGEQSAEFLALLANDGTGEYVQDYKPISYDSETWRKYAGVAISDGFVQVGYDSNNFYDDLAEHVQASVRNRHVGQTGGLGVVDQTGRVITASGEGASDPGGQLGADAASTGPGSLFETTYGGQDCFAMYQQVEGYSIVAIQPFAEAYNLRDVSTLVTAFMEVLVFAALFLVIYAVLKVVIVRSIRKMNGQLGQITLGNLDVVVDVRETSELASLSDDINKTVGVLKDSLEAVQSDLDMAAEIQANTLPTLTPEILGHGGFKLHASMVPAKEVGGDFYDFFMIDDDHLALVAADVSGKGIPAALFMMLSKTVIKMEALSGIAPDEVLYRANLDLSEKNDDDMFTTAWLGILELSTGRLVFADAGHEKLAIYRNGTWELPDKPNGAVALASFDREDYEDLPEKYHFRNCVLQLEPGDAIFQYSDGVTEATDAHDELFEEGRLLDALNDAPGADPREVLPFVHERIEEFVGDAPQFDDITMLGLQYTGTR